MDKFVSRIQSLVTAALVALCAAGAAARTVSVSSVADGNATLAFGDADGSAYTLARGYGAGDGGSATNAWDSFEILGTVAADATSQTVALPSGWGVTAKSLRFFLLAPESRPYAKRLEYIESSGSQWIDTEVRGKAGVEAEIDVACVTMGDNTVLGCRKDGGDTRFYPVHWANSKWWKGWLRGGVYWSQTADIALGTRYHVRSVFKSGEQAFYVDGVSKGTPTSETSTFDSGLDMYLFAANQYGSGVFQQAKARVYAAKIWLDGVLQRDFVPCEDENGEACLYDLVSGEYFRNGGSGTFAKGSEMPAGFTVAAASAACNWISANTLVVEAGSPTSVMSGATYDAVLLRDTLALRGGTLDTPSVVVDGAAGSLDIDGGTLPSTSRLALSPDLATENEYATVLALRSGKTTLQAATNANPAVAARIHFLGGSIGCTSFSGTPLCSANGGKWILEGAPGWPIRFGSLGLQRMSWLAGDGSVETRGHCDVVFDSGDYNAENDWRGTVYLNKGNTAWNHTGDLVLSNAVDVVCRADDCLPSGPQTGGIRFTWTNRAGPPPPRLDLNGRSVSVNGIRGTEGYGVTNSASTVATLRIGEGDTAGSITNLVLSGANINLVKRGAETNVVSLGGSDIAALRVEAGTLVVTGEAGMRLSAASVTVAEDATLVIERTVVGTSTFSGDGAVETLDGGTLQITFGDNDPADTLVWDDPELPEGNAFIKVGSNRAIVQTAEALDTDIDVRDGSLVFSGRTCTNEWYRFLFNGSQYQQSNQIAIGDLRVYSDTTGAENVAKGIGSGGNILAAGTDPANLAPGQCVAHFATTTTVPSGQSANLWDLRNAFDNDAYNAVLSAGTYYIYNNASQTWVAFRMAAGKNRVQSYLPAKASGITWYWHPSAWLFETSPDGVNWQTVDTRTGVLTSSGYGATPFPIKGFLADGAAGFDPAANVKVASGATLDASGVAGGQTLSRLTVDMSAGGGTIRGVTIAEDGVLDLVNVPAGLSLHDATIPVTLLDVADGSNFASWTVLSDGAPAKTGVLKFSAGGLSLFDGTTIFFIQ
ncbi:MAG: hypothetical protein IJ678_04580 [Kiritimatiellae bacterium]|nr:hypothetical protein [Kiritimatiellia bacterium]